MTTVLVVEDEKSIRESIVDVLMEQEYRAISASNGIEALQWLEQEKVDLILSDVMMPEMNGYQLFERIQQNTSWRNIPFIFLTGKNEREDIRYGKEMGIDDYLTKPLNATDLLSVVYGKLKRYQALHAQPQENFRKEHGKYQIANIIVELDTHQVWVNDLEISLSPTEFDILQQLIVNGKSIVDYDELWGSEQNNNDSDPAELVRYHIRNLRRKLESGGSDANVILNVRGHGYRLEQEPKRLS